LRFTAFGEPLQALTQLYIDAVLEYKGGINAITSKACLTIWTFNQAQPEQMDCQDQVFFFFFFI